MDYIKGVIVRDVDMFDYCAEYGELPTEELWCEDWAIMEKTREFEIELVLRWDQVLDSPGLQR